MNKRDIIREASKKSGISQRIIQRVLNLILCIILESIQNNKKVTLLGFGSFEIKIVPAHSSTNPQTGEPIKVEEKKKIRFKPSSKAIKNKE